MTLTRWQGFKGVKMMGRCWSLALPLLALGLIGCGGGALRPAGRGKIVITFDFPPATARLIPAGTTAVTVTVGGEGLTRPLKGTATRDDPRVVFSEVPPGPKFLLAFSRTDSEAPLPATMGAATAQVVAGETASVTIELQPVSPPTRVTFESGQLRDNDRNEVLLLTSTSDGLQWSGVISDRGTVTFSPLTLPNGTTVGAPPVSQPTERGTAEMQLVGVTGVGVPAGDFANCIVVKLRFSTLLGTAFQGFFFLARNFGPVLVSEVPLGVAGQPSGSVVPSVLVGGQVSGISPSPFSFANPVNLLSASDYDGQVSAYLPTDSGNLYKFSAVQSLQNPPGEPF